MNAWTDALNLPSIQNDKINGPLTVVGDCRGVGKGKPMGDPVRLTAQLEHGPEGA